MILTTFILMKFLKGATPSDAPAVEVEEETFSGGYGVLNDYESYRQRKKRRVRERRKAIEAIREIDDPTTREIAEILQRELIREERERQISELETMVSEGFRNETVEFLKGYSERVAKAYVRVYMQGNYSAVEALERELERAREDEEFLLIAVALL